MLLGLLGLLKFMKARKSLRSMTIVSELQLVVIFDADMVCYKDFFVKILAELYDPQVAIVLTPQKFHNYNIMCDIFNHSNLIYWQVSLPGLDGWDNVSCTGTNFVIRARAAQEVGFSGLKSMSNPENSPNKKSGSLAAALEALVK